MAVVIIDWDSTLEVINVILKQDHCHATGLKLYPESEPNNTDIMEVIKQVWINIRIYAIVTNDYTVQQSMASCNQCNSNIFILGWK